MHRGLFVARKEEKNSIAMVVSPLEALYLMKDQVASRGLAAGFVSKSLVPRSFRIFSLYSV